MIQKYQNPANPIYAIPEWYYTGDEVDAKDIRNDILYNYPDLKKEDNGTIWLPPVKGSAFRYGMTRNNVPFVIDYYGDAYAFTPNEKQRAELLKYRNMQNQQFYNWGNKEFVVTPYGTSIGEIKPKYLWYEDIKRAVEEEPEYKRDWSGYRIEDYDPNATTLPEVTVVPKEFPKWKSRVGEDLRKSFSQQLTDEQYDRLKWAWDYAGRPNADIYNPWNIIYSIGGERLRSNYLPFFNGSIEILPTRRQKRFFGDLAKKYLLSSINTEALKDFIGELSHGVQYKHGNTDTNRGFLSTNDTKELKEDINGDMRMIDSYETPFDKEFQTHSIIEPILNEYIFEGLSRDEIKKRLNETAVSTTKNTSRPFYNFLRGSEWNDKEYQKKARLTNYKKRNGGFRGLSEADENYKARNKARKSLEHIKNLKLSAL